MLEIRGSALYHLGTGCARKCTLSCLGVVQPKKLSPPIILGSVVDQVVQKSLEGSTDISSWRDLLATLVSAHQNRNLLDGPVVDFQVVRMAATKLLRKIASMKDKGWKVDYTQRELGIKIVNHPKGTFIIRGKSDISMSNGGYCTTIDIKVSSSFEVKYKFSLQNLLYSVVQSIVDNCAIATPIYLVYKVSTHTVDEVPITIAPQQSDALIAAINSIVETSGLNIEAIPFSLRDCGGQATNGGTWRCEYFKYCWGGERIIYEEHAGEYNIEMDWSVFKIRLQSVLSNMKDISYSPVKNTPTISIDDIWS